MSNYKILVKITGSIAAYKSAYIISRLIQDGNEVKVVASGSALKFIGSATLEGLTANPVYTDSFEAGKMMSHINLVKWSDLTIVCPASANTINKLSNGTGDTLLTSLFLAHDWSKPYLLAPAMNTAMFTHPATQESLKKLSGWGVKILPTAEGYLACGDYGSGKLLEPDNIISHIYFKLQKNNSGKAVLITAGGTKENIDGIRNITNLSTGKTAASIAQHFINHGYNVTYICSKDAITPNGPFEQIRFDEFNSLDRALKSSLTKKSYDLVIHNAAVSDYSLHSVSSGNEELSAPLKKKFSSEEEYVTITLKKNYKIVNRIRDYSKNISVKLISFKFTNEKSEPSRISQVNKLLSDSSSDFVVQNDLNDRSSSNEQKIFNIYKQEGLIDSVQDVNQLAERIESLVFQLAGEI